MDFSLSHPESESVSRQCLKKYRNRYAAFLSWSRSLKLCLDSAEQHDSALTSYCNELYLKGHQAQIGAETLAAVGVFVPAFGKDHANKLPRTLRSLKG